MAKTFTLDECSIKGELKAELYEKFCMIVPEKMIPGIYRVIFRSFAMICKYHASKQNHTVGFSLKDETGQFKIGTILTYNAPEDEDSDDEGNYVLSMTFDEKDMVGLDLNLDNFMDSFMTIVQTDLFAEMNTHCDDNSDLLKIIVEFIDQIKRFLDANSNDSSEDVELEMKSIFTATVSIENGEKVYSIVPGYSVKQIIKNDDENEKEETPMQKAAYFHAFNIMAPLNGRIPFRFGA